MFFFQQNWIRFFELLEHRRPGTAFDAWNLIIGSPNPSSTTQCLSGATSLVSARTRRLSRLPRTRSPLDQGVFDESIPEHIGYPKIIRFIGISTDKPFFFFVPSVFSIYFFNLILSYYIDLGMEVNDMFLYLRVGPFSVERISQYLFSIK